jgi:hypothetical protein
MFENIESSALWLAQSYPKLFIIYTPDVEIPPAESADRLAIQSDMFMLKSRVENKIIFGLNKYSQPVKNMEPFWKEYFSFYCNPEEIINTYSKNNQSPEELYALEAWYRMMIIGGANVFVSPRFEKIIPAEEGSLPVSESGLLIQYSRDNLIKINRLPISFDEKLILLAAVQEAKISDEELASLASVPSIFIHKILNTESLMSKIRDERFFIFKLS